MMFGRYLVRVQGTVTLTSALHIGSGDEDEGYGALVMRDQEGNPVIPATTLAGLLRGIAQQVALAGKYGADEPCLTTDVNLMCRDCAVCRSFGTTDAASKWEFEDAAWAECQVSGSDAREVRDSVGIDRQSGAAAPERLFQQEVVPKGARFKFQWVLQADAEDEIALAIHALDFWQEWTGRAGKASTAGLGAFKFSYTAERLDAHRPEEFERYLYDAPIDGSAAVEVSARQVRDYDAQKLIAKKRLPPDCDDRHAARLVFEAIRWHLTLAPVGPLQVKTDFPSEADELQVEVVVQPSPEHSITRHERPDGSFVRTGRVDGKTITEEHYIPGRSLKGVLRSYSERILRTCWALGHGDDRYIKSPEPVVCDPTRSSASRGGSPARLTHCEPDKPCPGCRLFGSTHFGGRVTVSEAFPVDTTAFSNAMKTLQRVSIDRITGGSADKRLFSGRPLFPPRDHDPRLDLGFTLELESPEDWQVGLTLFVLRDLCKERLRVGFGKYAGQGKVRAVISGCEFLTRQGSPVDNQINESELSPSWVGPFLHREWSRVPGVDIYGWYDQFTSLGDWATKGWTGFLREWAELGPKAEGVNEIV